MRQKQRNKNNQAAYDLAWRLRDVAAIAAALTGAFVIVSIAFAKINSAIGNSVAAGIVTAIVVAVVLFVIDFGLRTFLPFTIDLAVTGQAFRGGGWKGPIFFFLMLGLVGFQVFTSASLSWQSRGDVIDAIYKEPETADVAGLFSQMNEAAQQKVKLLQERAQQLRNSIAATEKQVSNNNGKLSALAKDGNGWAQGKLNKMKAAETSAMRAELEQTEKLITRAIADSETAITTTVATTQQANESKITRYEEVRSRNLNYVGYFGVSCTAIMVLLSFVLAMWPDVDSEERERVAVPPNLAPVNHGSDAISANLLRELRLMREEIIPKQQPPQQPATPVANSVQARKQYTITTGVDGDNVKQLQDTIAKLKASIRADESNLRKGNGNAETITARLGRKRKDLHQLESELNEALA